MTAMGIKPVIGVGRAHNDTFSREPPEYTFHSRGSSITGYVLHLLTLPTALRPQSERINIQNRIRFLYQPNKKRRSKSTVITFFILEKYLQLISENA